MSDPGYSVPFEPIHPNISHLQVSSIPSLSGPSPISLAEPSVTVPLCVDDPRPVTLFVGKGGVGKTTCACATALALAGGGRTVRLLSTDPAHSVRDVLAVGDLPTGDDGGALATATGAQMEGNLTVEELDAEAATDRFRERYGATLQDIVSRGTLFAEEDIATLLDLAFPGMDEVMAFLRLADVLSADRRPGREDEQQSELVVVDTAPFGHTLRLLDMPGRFSAWLDVLDAMLEKHRYMRSVFGSDGQDSLDAFLDEMYDRVARVETALADPESVESVIVTRPEPVIAAETKRMVAALQERSIFHRTVIVNCVAAADPRPAPASPADSSARWVSGHRALQSLAVPRCPALAAQAAGSRLEALAALWEDARSLNATPPAPSVKNSAPCVETSAPCVESPAPCVGNSAPCVESPARLPDARVLMVAGKGGVGKTTIATATALEIAHRRGDVLLASTDPAHSISDLCGEEEASCSSTSDAATSAGNPWHVADGLDAVEIDAEARFRDLHEMYAEEVSAFFDQAGGSNVDLVYDRAVAERLMDIAPPGIDEVMGWLAVMEFLDGSTYHDRRTYSTCVIDTAPTGHFLQLMAMPDLFVTWVRTFFRILRRHRDVLHLPELSDRLVRLSKQTKRWRAWVDEGHVQVITVSVPEPVVQAETLRLVHRVEEQGGSIPTLIMNRVTPSADRPAEESDLINACQEVVSTRHAMPLVHETANLVDRQRLKALGARLWRS